MLARKALGHTLDGLDLVQPAGDVAVNGDVRQRRLHLTLQYEVAQAVLGVETEEPPRGVSLRVVPDGEIEAVRIEDHRTPAIPLVQTIGVELRLRAPPLDALRGLLGFDHRQRAAIVVPEHVVGITDA
jgi:hypothetical protein